MASKPVITSPADYSTQAMPVTVSGTGTPGALVEIRDDAGLLVNATQNPVTVGVGGTWSMVLNALTNAGKNAGYMAASGQIANGVSAITYPTAGATGITSPVTFTGTAAPGSTVEIWDTAAVTQPVATLLGTGFGNGQASLSSTFSAGSNTLVLMACSMGTSFVAGTSVPLIGGNTPTKIGSTLQYDPLSLGIINIDLYYYWTGAGTLTSVTGGATWSGIGDWMTQVIGITGTTASGIGNTASNQGASASTGALTVTTGAAANSLILGYFMNFSSALPTAGASSSVVTSSGVNDGGGDVSIWLANTTSSTAATTAYTVNANFSPAGHWAGRVVEIKSA